MIKSIFKLPKYKQFNYEPRYYDPIKEEREERIRQIKLEMGLLDENSQNKGDYRSRIAGGFRRKTQSAQDRQTVITRLIIVAILSLVLYMFTKV